MAWEPTVEPEALAAMGELLLGETWARGQEAHGRMFRNGSRNLEVMVDVPRICREGVEAAERCREISRGVLVACEHLCAADTGDSGSTEVGSAPTDGGHALDPQAAMDEVPTSHHSTSHLHYKATASGSTQVIEQVALSSTLAIR